MSAQIGKIAPNLKVSEWVQGNDTNLDQQRDNVVLVEVFLKLVDFSNRLHLLAPLHVSEFIQDSPGCSINSIRGGFVG